uniref:Cyclin-like domain-containing protein n=1 Tax=viral metagenome TaxID=1070528 RepID=A0A6C0CPD7_9ZZZZ
MKNSTKKIKKKLTKKNKIDLWKQFDDEINEKMECVFDEKNIKITCDLCQSPVLLSEQQFPVCTNKKCGIIYKDVLDQAPEWRYYGADDNNSRDPTRCGMPINPLLKQSSYGCKVVCGNRSSYEMKKIRRYTEWQSMPYTEKALYDEFEKIKILAGQSGIPKIIIDEALRQHKKISEMRTFRGLNRDGIIAASIYIACRVNLFPRTAKEIAVIFRLDASSSTKGCKNATHLINNLEVNENDNNKKTFLGKSKPINFIERFCSKLNINNELTKLCKFIAIQIEKKNIIPENTPHSVAAGIIYFVSQTCKLNISKKDVYNVSTISEVTINKCYKKLINKKTQLIPSVILEKYS